MQPDKFKLLERYHDGQVSAEEAAAVERLLEQDPEALEYLGGLDEVAEMTRMLVEEELSKVSFGGLWSRVEVGIKAHDQAVAAAKAPAAPAPQGLWSWLRGLFAEHRGAWVTAGATALAVALVMAAFGQFGGERVIERQIVYVDSVDQANAEGTVLVKHIEGNNTAIIWTLPAAQPSPEKEEEDEGGIEIIDEPL
jgi:hypothetical protein